VKKCRTHPDYDGVKKRRGRPTVGCACASVYDHVHYSPPSGGPRSIRRSIAKTDPRTFIQDRSERQATADANVSLAFDTRTTPRTGSRSKHSARSRYTPAYAEMIKHGRTSKPVKLAETKRSKIEMLFLNPKRVEEQEPKPIVDGRASADVRQVIEGPWKDLPKLYSKKGRPTGLLLTANARKKKAA
jgi:hypothetical protein